jgi:hypothetical protein
MPVIGTLSTILTLDSKNLDAGARKAAVALKGVESSANHLIKRMTALAIAVAGPAAFIAFTKHGLAAVDSNEKLARSIDGTIDGLRTLKAIANDSGVDGLEQSLAKLNETIEKAADGNAEANKTFQILGVALKTIHRVDVDSKMAMIADRIKASGMNAQEAAKHLKDLGFTQRNAVDMFMNGGDAIREARAEIEKYGLSLSDIDVAKVGAVNDAISDTKTTFEAVANKLAARLAPELEYIFDLINDMAKATGGFEHEIELAIGVAVGSFGFLADSVEGVRRVLKLATLSVAAFSAAAMHDILLLTKKIFDGPVDAVNYLIKQYNLMARAFGFEIDLVIANPVGETLQREIDAAYRDTIAAVDMMQEVLMEDMPSTKIEKKLDEIRNKARKAAEEVVRSQRKIKDELVVKPVEETDEEKRARESAEARLQAIRDSLMTEEELRTTQYARQIEEMRLLHENLGLEDAAFKELSLQAEQQYMEDIKSIRERGMSEIERIQAMSMSAQVGLVTGELGNMFAAYAGHSKKMNKAAQIAGATSALISTFQGQAEALKLGWPMGVIAAAKIGAAGLGFVSAIKGAGSGGSGGGAGSAASSTAISAPPAQRFDVSLSGFNPNQAMGMNQMGGVMDFINTRIRAGETFGGFSY